MARWKRHYWTTLGSSILATGVHLGVTTDTVAHSGPHGKEAEQGTHSAADDYHTPSHEAAGSTSGESGADAMVMPSSTIPTSTASETSVRKIPVVQASSSASMVKASASEGFSFGFGEFLLGLVVVGPFLLISLKKQLQS